MNQSLHFGAALKAATPDLDPNMDPDPNANPGLNPSNTSEPKPRPELKLALMSNHIPDQPLPYPYREP